jgi:hypothetical protein
MSPVLPRPRNRRRHRPDQGPANSRKCSELRRPSPRPPPNPWPPACHRPRPSRRSPSPDRSLRCSGHRRLRLPRPRRLPRCLARRPRQLLRDLRPCPAPRRAEPLAEARSPKCLVRQRRPAALNKCPRHRADVPRCHRLRHVRPSVSSPRKKANSRACSRCRAAAPPVHRPFRRPPVPRGHPPRRDSRASSR